MRSALSGFNELRGAAWQTALLFPLPNDQLQALFQAQLGMCFPHQCAGGMTLTGARNFRLTILRAQCWVAGNPERIAGRAHAGFDEPRPRAAPSQWRSDPVHLALRRLRIQDGLGQGELKGASHAWITQLTAAVVGFATTGDRAGAGPPTRRTVTTGA